MNDERRGLPSASAMYRLEQCPGSHHFIGQLRDQGLLLDLPNKYGSSGTKIHAWLGARRTEREKLELSSDELFTAGACEKLRDELIGQWFGSLIDVDDPPPNLAILREKRFWYRRGIVPVFSGQIDVVIIDRKKDRAWNCNYKTGRIEPEPLPDNRQLRVETVLLKSAFGSLKEIQASIVEPWVSWEREFVRYDESTLPAAESHVLQIVDRLSWDTETFNAGEWCRYCPARVRCKAARDFISQTYRVAKAFNANLANFPRGKDGDKIIDNIALVRGLLDSIEDGYKNVLATEPEALEGHYLHEGKRNRWITNLSAARQTLAPLLSGEEFDDCARWSVSRLEKRFLAKGNLKGEEGEEAFASFMGQLIGTTNDAPYISKITKAERTRRAEKAKALTQ